MINDHTANDEFKIATLRGCKPMWCDGIFGFAWHCTCEDNTHGCDQQCSAITLKSVWRRK